MTPNIENDQNSPPQELKEQKNPASSCPKSPTDNPEQVITYCQNLENLLN